MGSIASNSANSEFSPSIPNGATDQYIKTIPLTGLGSNVTTALVVFNSYEAFSSASINTPANGFGVTSGGFYSLDGQGSSGFTYSMVEVGARLLVTTNYQDAKRPQSLPNAGAAKEVNETGVDLIAGTNPNYTQIFYQPTFDYNFYNGFIFIIIAQMSIFSIIFCPIITIYFFLNIIFKLIIHLLLFTIYYNNHFSINLQGVIGIIFGCISILLITLDNII